MPPSFKFHLFDFPLVRSCVSHFYELSIPVKHHRFGIMGYKTGISAETD